MSDEEGLSPADTLTDTRSNTNNDSTHTNEEVQEPDQLLSTPCSAPPDANASASDGAASIVDQKGPSPIDTVGIVLTSASPSTIISAESLEALHD
jgi:hypothetical protein